MPVWLSSYAPWCGHCKHLAPIWDDAASKLLGKLNMGKIDCTVHTDVCNSYNVRGYPTLKYFRSGAVREYTGGRTLEAITTYADRVTGPAVGDVDASNIAKFLASPGSKFLYFGTGSIKQDDVLVSTAERFVDSASFGMASDQALKSRYGVTSTPMLVAIRGESKDDTELYSGAWDAESLAGWISPRRVPVLGELTSANANDYMSMDEMTVLTLIDPAAASAKNMALKRAREVAIKHQGKLHFAWVDGNRLSGLVEQFELTNADLPQTVVWNSRDSLFFNNKSVKTLAEIDAFVNDVLNERVEAKGEGRGWLADSIRAVEKLVSNTTPLTITLVILGVFAAFAGVIYCVLADSGEEVDLAASAPSTRPPVRGEVSSAAAHPAAATADVKKNQ